MTDERKRVQIDIKRTGFDVTIGEFDLFFDSSMENLQKFLTIEELVEAKTLELEEVLAELPETDSNEERVENYEKAQLIMQAQMEVAWDTIFGAGTFKKLYEKYPDIWALSDAFDTAGVAIAERMQEMSDERLEALHGIKKDMLEKKAKKTADR